MSLPVIIQNSGVIVGTSVTSINLVLTNVTTGNAIIIGGTEWTGFRTLSASDTQSNVYTNRINITNSVNSKYTSILDKINATGVAGSLTITVTDSASGNISATADEVSNLVSAGNTGSLEETVGVSQHASVSSPISYLNNSYGMTSGQLNADDRPYSAIAFNTIGDDGTISFFQSAPEPVAGSIVGLWQSNSNLRLNTGVIAFYDSAAAAGGYLLVKN